MCSLDKTVVSKSPQPEPQLQPHKLMKQCQEIGKLESIAVGLCLIKIMFLGVSVEFKFTAPNKQYKIG